MSAFQLETAAAILGPILDEVVFVGGATVHLWLTEPGAPPARATEDVDVVCEVATRVEYHGLGTRLRERGLREAFGEPVICRWRSADPELVLDVMPTAPDRDLRAYVQGELVELQAQRDFDYAVDGTTASYGPVGADRANLVRERIDRVVAGR